MLHWLRVCVHVRRRYLVEYNIGWSSSSQNLPALVETRSIDLELCPNVPGKHKEHKVSQQPTAYHPYLQRTLTSEALSIDGDAKPNMRTRYISHAIQPPRSNSYHPIHCTNFSTRRESAHSLQPAIPSPFATSQTRHPYQRINTTTAHPGEE